MSYPTWEEVFDKPWPTPTVPCPAAWQGDSVAIQLADEECARLIVEALKERPQWK
jgi:hypothetical protein